MKCVQFNENAELIEVDKNEETVDIKEELDDIDKKFVETKVEIQVITTRKAHN